MKIFFFKLIFCLVGLVKCSSETTFLVNQTPATLTLDYYDNVLGNFVNYPPQTVQPYSNVTWIYLRSLRMDGILCLLPKFLIQWMC